MDINLTGHLWGMPIVQTPGTWNWLLDVLPSVTSVIVVLIGSSIAYYTTIIIERRKRLFDIKKQIYFEAAEFFSAITLFEYEENLDYKRAPEMNEEEYHNEYRQEREHVWESWSNNNKVTSKLILLKYKLELCGAPRDILENINKLKDYTSENNPTQMRELIIEKLIPALSDDIRKENSWKPWK